MTVRIEDSNISPVNLVGGTSRYANSKVIYYGEDRLLTLTTYKRKEISVNPTDSVYLITPAYEYRPDLLAYKKYGIAGMDMWWKILEVNKIRDIWDFKAGKTIILPGNIFFN